MEVTLKLINGVWVSETGMVFKELPQHTRGSKTHRYNMVVHKGQKYDVHRLVAQAFLPNPESKRCVCHKDDNPQNNHVTNLWWGTHKENMQDMINKGRNRFFKNQSKNLDLVLDGISMGKTLREVAAELGVTESRVSQILSSYRRRLAKRERAKDSEAFVSVPG